MLRRSEAVAAAAAVGAAAPPEGSSTVLLRRCRYLEASGCKSECVNICKVPTQTYFATQLGMPLTMRPNFEDKSCELIFGMAPPSPEDDPAFRGPCLVGCARAPAVGAPGAPACHAMPALGAAAGREG